MSLNILVTLTYRALSRIALISSRVESISGSALHGNRFTIETQEVVVTVASVGQEHQVLGVSPGGARLLLHLAIGQCSGGALLGLGTKEQATGTVLLYRNTVDALHKLGARRGMRQTSGSGVGTGVDVGQDPVGGRKTHQGHKGSHEKELHRFGLTKTD